MTNNREVVREREKEDTVPGTKLCRRVQGSRSSICFSLDSVSTV